MSFYFIRLGLFLVYTLPRLSNMNEGDGIPDGDLSQDMPGTPYNTQPHLMQYITCLMGDTSCYWY